MAPTTVGSQPNFRARSVPNDQPTSHGRGSPRNSASSMAAATSYFSPSPPSNVPSLVPRGDEVPRVLNRRTARSASAGRRQAALRYTWESMKPPCVGSGWKVSRLAAGSAVSGSASSPTRVRPSAVCSSTSSRCAGRTVSERIWWDVWPEAVSGVASVVIAPIVPLAFVERSTQVGAPLPAARVPVPPAVQPGLGAAEHVRLPRDDVRRSRRDLLPTGRADVGLVGRSDPLHHPLAVGRGLAATPARCPVHIKRDVVSGIRTLAGAAVRRHGNYSSAGQSGRLDPA